MAATISAVVSLVLMQQYYKLVEGKVWYETKSFYIRHHFGKCLEYSPARKALVYVTICREKFRWSSGTHLLHMPTKKCIVVNSTADYSLVSLTSQCTDTKTLFRYDETKRVLFHLTSGKCLHPEAGATNPGTNSSVVIKKGCSEDTNKYYFRPNAHYVIRHFGGLCWVYSAVDNLLRLEQPTICDRFHYENDYKLKHVNTGKCITGTSYSLSLTDDCSGTQSHLQPTSYSNIGNPPTACVHPTVSWDAPPLGVKLVLWPNGCNDANSIRFYFFDDTDILNVKMLSKDCQTGACTQPRSQLAINGFKRNNDWDGILWSVFDYRSGLREDMASYNLAQSDEINKKFVERLSKLPPGKIVLFVSRGKVKLNVNSAILLQKHGVSAAYASTASTDFYATMVTIAYTGSERKSWEKSLYSMSGGEMAIETSIKTFVDVGSENECSQELGIRTGKIPDSSFNASSVWDNQNKYMAFRARLHERDYGGWCSGEAPALSQFIQVDLGVSKVLSGIAIQGNNSAMTYLLNYSIEYSSNGIGWQVYSKLGQTNRAVLPGVYGDGKDVTRVHWLERNVVVRYVRIIPSSSSSTNNSCVRFELFGCGHRTTFEVRSLKNLEFTPWEMLNTSLTVYAIGPRDSSVMITVSSAASTEDVGQKIDQFHIQELNGIKTKASSNEIMPNDKVKKSTQKNSVNIASSGTLSFDIGIEDYYKFDVNISLQVMDSQQASGNVSTIASIETTDGVSVISKRSYFQRPSEDKSYMTLNCSDVSNEILSEGATIEFNTSVFHIHSGQNRSTSNAYSVEVLAYYDSTHMEFVTLNVTTQEYWNIGPSRNATQPGLVYLQTDLFSFHNKQIVSVTLKIKRPTGVMKGSKGEGAVVIDFGYKSNLERFNGTATKNTVKIINYKFKINDSNKENEVMLGYRIPKFTMAYDGINGFFFFCFQKKQFLTRNYPNCYWQRHNSFTWNRISDIVAILGIDVSSRFLYGIHSSGSVYLRAAFPFNEFYQIENSMWESAKDKSVMRKSIAVSDLSSMPTTITQKLTISYGAVDLWAATRWNIMRKYGTVWRKVVQF